MMKRVCHLTNAHERYDLRILKKECISLFKHGYDVSLLVQDDLPDEILDGVKIISTKSRSVSRIKRLVSINKLYKLALSVNADVYHLHDPELLYVGLKLKRMNKIVIFDSHEDIPIQIADKDYIPQVFRKALSNAYRTFEKFVLKHYDGIITVTPHIAERLSRIHSTTTVITNYPLLEVVPEPEPSSRNRAEVFTICFAGGITEQWNIDLIINAISTMENVRFLLAGPANGSYLDYLRGLAGWEKVEYLGHVAHSDVLKIYRESQVGCALNFSRQLMNNGSLGNTKLFEFMAAALPVICTDYPAWKEVVETSDCGLCIDPKDVDGIRNAIRMLMSNDSMREDMGQNGHMAFLNEYNWTHQEMKLVAFYQRLLSGEHDC